MWCTSYRYTNKPLLTGLISGTMADKARVYLVVFQYSRVDR